MVWALILVMSPTSWGPLGLLLSSSVMFSFRHCRMGHVTPRKREKARVSVLTASSHLVLEILVNSIRQEREIKYILRKNLKIITESTILFIKKKIKSAQNQKKKNLKRHQGY